MDAVIAELYPRAAILAAWTNAWAAGRADGLVGCPGAAPDQPLLGPAGRQPLGQALALRIAEHGAALRATALLPVPGDPAGLPPAAEAPRVAGQALALSASAPGEPSEVIYPATAGAGRATVWRTLPATVAPAALVADLRAARLETMELLPRAVAAAEAVPGRALQDARLRARLGELEQVPLPPGSSPAAVDLAASSAKLLAIVAAAGGGLTAEPERGARILAELRPLAMAGRRALAAAFSRATPDQAAD